MMLNENKKYEYALGMIKIDGIEPSNEWKELVEKEIAGMLTLEDIKKVMDKKHKIK